MKQKASQYFQKEKKVKQKPEYLTFMMIPHSGQNVRKLQIPILYIKRAKYVGVVLTVISLFLVYSYLGMKKDTVKLNHLEEENEVQREKIVDYSQKMHEIEVELKELDELDEQVRKMLNLKDQSAQPQNNSVLKAAKGNLASRSLNYGERSNHEEMNIDQSQIEMDELTERLKIIGEALQAKKDNLTELKKAMEVREARLSKIPSIPPISGRITSGFGYRKHPVFGTRIFHDGIDMASYYGAPIHAAAAGTVVFSGNKSGYGKTVIINHGNGFRTLYAHNSKLLVDVGDRIEKNEVIANLGNSGRSTGPHVHYEIHKNGQLVDPAKYF